MDNKAVTLSHGEKMSKDVINKKSFVHNGQTIYYFVKNIEWKEIRGKEMASVFMVICIICNENDDQNDFFAIHDERNKVMYAMPDDAKRWYEEYKRKS